MSRIDIRPGRFPFRYDELTWQGHNLGTPVERLRGSKVKADAGAHLDPDLRPDLRPDHLERPEGWCPLLAKRAHLRGTS